jgi:predicted aspartyl protease
MFRAALLLVVAVGAACAAPDATGRPLSSTASGVASETVPMELEDNRVFVTLGLRRPDGTSRAARAWVDTGGGGLLFSARLAAELALARTGPTRHEGAAEFAPVAAPSMWLGNMPLALGDAQPMELVGTTSIRPGIDAYVMLPARVLRNYQVVFDYPLRTFTLAQPGSQPPRGKPVPSPVDAKSGFARVEVEISGKTYPMLLDTGASYTMLSRSILDAWAHALPWPSMTGAVEEANMVGRTDAEALVVRVPGLTWGGTELPDVGIVSRRAGVYEDWMSPMMTAPIFGALAGNVLRAFRVEIDYAHGTTYLEASGTVEPDDLDSPGIVFETSPDGAYRVAGITQRAGSAIVSGVHPGDRIISVDSLTVTGATRDAVIRALRGKPGDIRHLHLERDGVRVDLDVVVQRLP